MECRSSTNMLRKDILWMLEQAKVMVLNLEDDE